MKNAFHSFITLAGIGVAIALPLYVAFKYDAKQRAEQEDAQAKIDILHQEIVEATFDNANLDHEGKAETYAALTRMADNFSDVRSTVRSANKENDRRTYSVCIKNLTSDDADKIQAAVDICIRENKNYETILNAANEIQVKNASFKAIERIVTLITTAFKPGYYTQQIANKIIESC